MATVEHRSDYKRKSGDEEAPVWRSTPIRATGSVAVVLHALGVFSSVEMCKERLDARMALLCKACRQRGGHQGKIFLAMVVVSGSPWPALGLGLRPWPWLAPSASALRPRLAGTRLRPAPDRSVLSKRKRSVHYTWRPS